MFKGLSCNISLDQIDLDIDEPKKKVTNNSVNSKKFTKDEKKITKVNDIESNKQIPILSNSCNKYSKVEEKHTEDDDIELGIQKSNISVNDKKFNNINKELIIPETFNQKLTELEKIFNKFSNRNYNTRSKKFIPIEDSKDNEEIDVKNFENLLCSLFNSKEYLVSNKVDSITDNYTKPIYDGKILLFFMYNFIFSIVLIAYTDKFIKLLNQDCIHSLDKYIPNIRFLIDFGFYYYLPLIYCPIILSIYSLNLSTLSNESKISIFNFENDNDLNQSLGLFIFSMLLIFLLLLVKYTYIDGLYLVTCVSGYPYKDDDSENDLSNNFDDNNIDDIEYRKESVDKFELLDSLRNQYESHQFDIKILATISIIASIIYLLVSICDSMKRFNNPNENDSDFIDNNNLKYLNNIVNFFSGMLISDSLFSMVTVFLLICFGFSKHWTVILYYVMSKKGDLTSYNLSIFFYYMFLIFFILVEIYFGNHEAAKALLAFETKNKMTNIQKLYLHNNKIEYIKNFIEFLNLKINPDPIIDPIILENNEHNMINKKIYFVNKIRNDLYLDDLIINEKKIIKYYYHYLETQN